MSEKSQAKRFTMSNSKSNKNSKKEVKKTASLVKNLMFVVSATGIFLAGSVFGASSVFKNPNSPFAQITNTALGQPGNIDFAMFWDVYSKVKNNYPGDFNDQDWVYGAIKGAVGSIGDKYSLFLTPEESKKFFEAINGEFAGIGAEIGQENDLFVVVAPLPNTPAQAAGLKSKDIILAVDGKDASEFEFGELINKIRGEKGTKVTLKIMREGFEEPKDIIITRDIIRLESLESKMLDNNHGYVRLIQFSDDSVSEFTKAVDDLIEKGAKDLVIDLRDNPGGYLNAAIDLTSLFVDKGPIVSEVKKGDKTEDFAPTLAAKYKDLDIVVLINGGSASASEIMAGAIQDRGRGKIVGVQSFGKGSVQEIQNLDGGAALKLTTAKWRTPSGRFINGKGITPDVPVEDDTQSDKDEQLDAAINQLK